jgi:hypothetical protein
MPKSNPIPTGSWHLRSQQRLIEFDPDQPRWPKGTPFGGRWRKLGGVLGEITPADLSDLVQERAFGVNHPLMKMQAKVLARDAIMRSRHQATAGIAKDLQGTESMRALTDWVASHPDKGVKITWGVDDGMIEMDGFWGTDAKYDEFGGITLRTSSSVWEFFGRNPEIFRGRDGKTTRLLKDLKPGEKAEIEAKAKRLSDAWRVLDPKAPGWSDLMQGAGSPTYVIGKRLDENHTLYVENARYLSKLTPAQIEAASSEAREALADFKQTARKAVSRVINEKLRDPKWLSLLLSDWLVSHWEQDSSGRSHNAWWVHEGARRTFGLPELPKRDPKRASGVAANAASANWERVSDEKIYGPRNRVLQDMLRIIYRRTQEQLPPGDSFLMYRGLGAHGVFKAGEHQVVLNPLTSWTSDGRTAFKFAVETPTEAEKYVAIARVPRERIFSWSLSGMGYLGQYEVLVLGSGPAKVNLIDPGKFAGYLH